MSKKKAAVRVLAQKETTALLGWLEKDRSSKGMTNAAIINMLLTSPHLFRRCYAMLFSNSGIGSRAIQQKTRHTSIKTLVHHYIHDEESIGPYFEKIFGKKVGER